MSVLDPMTEKVDGLVVESKKEVSTKGSGGASVVTCHFMYKYTYHGHTYTSRTHDYKGGIDGECSGYHNYRRGDPIEIYIDPQRPRLATIEKGWSFNHILLLLLGFGFMWRLHALLTGAWPSYDEKI